MIVVTGECVKGIRRVYFDGHNLSCFKCFYLQLNTISSRKRIQIQTQLSIPNWPETKSVLPVFTETIRVYNRRVLHKITTAIFLIDGCMPRNISIRAFPMIVENSWKDFGLVYSSVNATAARYLCGACIPQQGY